jgi:hypothetical protein
MDILSYHRRGVAASSAKAASLNLTPPDELLVSPQKAGLAGAHHSPLSLLRRLLPKVTTRHPDEESGLEGTYFIEHLYKLINASLFNPTVTDPSKAFFATIGCNKLRHSPYAKWYSQFLRMQFSSISPHILRTLPSGDLDNRDNDIQQEKEIFRCLECIAEMLSREKNLPLAQISEYLGGKNLWKTSNDFEEATLQFSFIIVGFLTMFYQPKLKPRLKMLQIDLQMAGSTCDTWFSDEIEIATDVAAKPLTDLLRKFGGYRGPIPRAGFLEEGNYAGARRVRDSTSLCSSNINFYTLRKLARIRVIWTTSACQHLEFDARDKTLKLFCYPSFCGLICTAPRHPGDLTVEPAEPGRTYLCQ